MARLRNFIKVSKIRIANCARCAKKLVATLPSELTPLQPPFWNRPFLLWSFLPEPFTAAPASPKKEEEEDEEEEEEEKAPNPEREGGRGSGANQSGVSHKQRSRPSTT